ncbi:MAG TPA: ParB/RepB/Spo0J family partition protein [Mucilaginibacter sp.]|nr:ParB/RepB/Spo0J family partition protein [Mucilaginibacter sp.]
MDNISPVIEYQDKIQDLTIDKIVPNDFNPRERFNEEEEDELIESILNKGILNPIIVYKRKQDDKYIILDGERRYRACKKLNIKTIPARILVREPNVLESLSLMFHIQNVRQEWTEFAISITIKRIIDELGKKFESLNSSDIKYLSEITSLSEYRVRKYLKFLDYPDDVIQMFLHNEVYQKKGIGPDPDILLEMHKPIEDMRDIMPSLLEDFSIKNIIDACIEKKERGIIKANKEFRLISKSLTAARKDEINVSQLERNLYSFFSILDYSPENVYRHSAETVYLYKSIRKNSESFLSELKDFDFNSIDAEKRNEVLHILNQIALVISRNL